MLLDTEPKYGSCNEIYLGGERWQDVVCI